MHATAPLNSEHKTTVQQGRAPREQSHLARWTDLPGVELLVADYKRHAYVPHWHDTLTIALVAKGCMRIHIAGTGHLVMPGNVVLLEPGRIHDGEAHDAALGWEYRVFYLDTKVMERAAVDMGLASGATDTCKHSVILDRQAWRSLLQVHTDLSSNQTLLERSSTLAQGLSDFIERTCVDRTGELLREKSSPGLSRAREYLHANWAQPLSLDELAAVAGLSRFHFLRAFRNRYGLPPHTYQLQMRVHRAREMMFQGLPAKDVALETGFHDQAHLSHTMRRFAGIVPGQIREYQRSPAKTKNAGSLID